MKRNTEKIIAQGSLALNKYFHNFFAEEAPISTEGHPVNVLPVQPLRQRKLFAKLAIQEHRNIFMQLNPLTAAGCIINCRGYLSSLPNGRFLLKNDHITYFFSLQQIRYIAG